MSGTVIVQGLHQYQTKIFSYHDPAKQYDTDSISMGWRDGHNIIGMTANY